jgi:DNA helicase-2/ATP-dependent DNA helicase PcrA
LYHGLSDAIRGQGNGRGTRRWDQSIATGNLRDLNPAQRSAAEYGIGGDMKSPPALLIAAGAGTGKTKTLAHRVAYLILNGANPHRSVWGRSPIGRRCAAAKDGRHHASQGHRHALAAHSRPPSL